MIWGLSVKSHKSSLALPCPACPAEGQVRKPWVPFLLVDRNRSQQPQSQDEEKKRDGLRYREQHTETLGRSTVRSAVLTEGQLSPPRCVQVFLLIPEAQVPTL